MSDEDRRKRERVARAGAADGDEVAAATVERDESRIGSATSRVAWLQRHVGISIFIEGIRINWRGTLIGILSFGDGRVSDLVLGPCQRIGAMDETGPNKSYTLTVNAAETLVPWETVIGVLADEGFNGKKWPKIHGGKS